MINDNSDNLLEQPVDNEDKISNDESQDELLEEEELEEFRYNWMHLAKMGPNAYIESNSDLGLQDLNQNYNWIDEAQQNYSSENLATAYDFVHKASCDSINNATEPENESTK